MKFAVEEAYAKINLTLDILGTRPDGYHEMDMVMQSVSLSDTITLFLHEKAGVQVTSNQEGLPQDRRNLAVDAACRFLEAIGREEQGLSIEITKRIPVCAGTAGGSSDAAAVLRGLNRLTGAGLPQQALMEIGSKVGSDVSYCILGGTARATGRGEVLSQLSSLPDCWIVLCKPNFSVSTPELFHRWDQQLSAIRPDTKKMLNALQQRNLTAVAHELNNVFEAVLPPEIQGVVITIRRLLSEQGALGTCMSGTGPTVFALFDRNDLAEKAVTKLKDQYQDVFLTRPV
ncbi:MAG: 4-diphosphocytidyl-2-C-methyl-D-erythritol kinase [Evtepia sp.]|jgi:4-diphosphocytidyl-2-C-methyl-D-erythritol kinase|nr:4-diphosphocytidyl-2-C-methyl-D-erythritol kinase [Evtepia sp.]